MTGVLELYTWFLMKMNLFDTFSSVFQAWLQNLLGNVITFNTLYSKIEEAIEAGNRKEIYYWYGRFITLFINFEPIVSDPADDFDGGFQDDIFLATVPAATLGLAASQDTRLRQSHVNGNNMRHGPVVGGFVTNVYGFSTGFVNASFGDASPNSAIC